MDAGPAEIEALAYERWGLSVRRTGGEWHSPCPWCGGRDRFWITRRGYYSCRRCGRGGWLDEERPWDGVVRARPPVDRAAEMARALERLRSEAERAAYEMGRDDERKSIAREYFTREGISLARIERHGLGYTPDHVIALGGEYYRLGAYTIPIVAPESGELVNMQYRLADPPAGVGKYRQAPGLPAAAFFAESTLAGDALVVEGAKKAIVVSQFIRSEAQVVGLPGKKVSGRVLEQLRGFERVYVMLDPDAWAEAERIAQALAPRARVVRLPDKPDDLIVKGGMQPAHLRAYLESARRVV